MRRSMALGTVTILNVALIGCGQNTNVSGTQPSYAYEVTWNNTTYSVSPASPLKEVGGQIGTIKHFEENPQGTVDNWSNFFPVGTKLFTIPGNNPKDKIAGEFKGKYIECDAFTPPK